MAWGLLHAPTLILNPGGPYMHWLICPVIVGHGLADLSSREGRVLCAYIIISLITPRQLQIDVCASSLVAPDPLTSPPPLKEWESILG